MARDDEAAKDFAREFFGGEPEVIAPMATVDLACGNHVPHEGANPHNARPDDDLLGFVSDLFGKAP